MPASCPCAAQLAFVEGLAGRSHYHASASREGAAPRPRTVRIAKEVGSLGTDLPLNPSSSVFLRVDEQNMVLWQALITGARAACALVQAVPFKITGCPPQYYLHHMHVLELWPNLIYTMQSSRHFRWCHETAACTPASMYLLGRVDQGHMGCWVSCRQAGCPTGHVRLCLLV